MGIFKNKNLNEVETGGGADRRYFVPQRDGTTARYVVEIDSIKLIQTRKNTELLAVETKILESDNEDRPVGSSCNWAQDLARDVAPRNVKSVLAAAAGLDPQKPEQLQGEDWDEVSAAAVSDAQPFQGSKLVVEVWSREKQTKPGEYYAHHRFSPVTA